MKTYAFNQQSGATAGYTLRVLLDTIPDDIKSMKHGV
jgi:hypothetical protein